jgi:hypothetical protein
MLRIDKTSQIEQGVYKSNNKYSVCSLKLQKKMTKKELNTLENHYYISSKRSY